MINPSLDPGLIVFSIIGLVMLHMATVRFWAEIFRRKTPSREAMSRHITGLLLNGLQPVSRTRTGKSRERNENGGDHASPRHLGVQALRPRRCSYVDGDRLFPQAGKYLSGLYRRQICLCRLAAKRPAGPSFGDARRHDRALGIRCLRSTPSLRQMSGRQANRCCEVLSRGWPICRRETPAEVDVTRAQLVQAVAEKKQADEILTSDEAQYRAGGIPQTDLINAQAAAERAPPRYGNWKPILGGRCAAGARATDQGADEQVAADRASLADAAWNLQQKQIASPRQGLVFDTLYREGEWVAAGNPVVQLLPPENLEVRFFVPETIVGKLRVGQSIRVHCDGCAADSRRDDQLHFAAKRIHAAGDLQQRESVEAGVHGDRQAVRCRSAAALHPGQPIEVTLQ